MKENFRRKVLANGLTIIFEKRDIPVVSCLIAVRSGGMNETLDEKGISHYIEHMLYKGTPSRNAFQIAEAIEQNGGDLNGFTSEEVTAFWCKVPSKYTEESLKVLIDMVKNPLFDEKELEKERKVIFEEIKMRKDVPNIYAVDKIQNLLYEGSLGLDTIGTYETMNSITKEKISKKFKEIYTPNNMVLSLVGNYDFEKLVQFIEKNFGDEIGIIPHLKIKKKTESIIETKKGIDQASLIFAFHAPLADNPLSAAAEVLMTLMAGGMSSRLFSEIREKRNLAYTVKGEFNVSKDYSYIMVYVGTTRERIVEIRKLISREFKKVCEFLTEGELSKIKEKLIGSYQISMEDSQSQMIGLLQKELEGDASTFYDFEEQINKVKLEEVKKVAKMAEHYSFFALVPEDK